MSNHPLNTLLNSNLIGRVKWFNHKNGYGFISVNLPDSKDTFDLFVHHTSIITNNQLYKYLLQGEYVQITLTQHNNRFQATQVQGINQGKLMCETRHELQQHRHTPQHTSQHTSQQQQQQHSHKPGKWIYVSKH